jgi:hypothetical protein
MSLHAMWAGTSKSAGAELWLRASRGISIRTKGLYFSADGCCKRLSATPCAGESDTSANLKKFRPTPLPLMGTATTVLARLGKKVERVNVSSFEKHTRPRIPKSRAMTELLGCSCMVTTQITRRIPTSVKLVSTVGSSKSLMRTYALRRCDRNGKLPPLKTLV